MCGICGCERQEIKHSDEQTALISIEQDIFLKNNQLAKANKDYFNAKDLCTFNIMSSPGSGKTTLLTQTIIDLKAQKDFGVLVGDQHTDEDAKDFHKNGIKAIQINTGRTCHLDAHQVSHALDKTLHLANAILFIENVGNLVCPALFHLGEHYRIALLSVTEGDNKPLKYPDMFRCIDLLLLTKMDLLPYVNFNMDRCADFMRRLKPDVKILPLSATHETSLTPWYEWLLEKANAALTINH